MGESAPRLRSRKNDAESWDATTIIIGFWSFMDALLIAGNEAQTLPFKYEDQNMT
jgi:hypothetical protein